MDRTSVTILFKVSIKPLGIPCCREEDGVTPSEVVYLEKLLVVVPQNTWKSSYPSLGYWAIKLKRTLVFLSTFHMHTFTSNIPQHFWRLPDILLKHVCCQFCGHYLLCTDFFNWNRVKVRYCDGASFSGDSQNEVSQSMKELVFFSLLSKLFSNILVI